MDVPVFIDSRADADFIDISLAHKLTLELELLERPRNHHDRITFLLTRSPEIPVILGHPWLIKHSPVINWLTEYDCAIDLRPGTTPPRGRLYSISGPERGAMEEYISDTLKAGLIRKSSSPESAGFFVGKKDGSLRPCIDYRGLNEVTVKNGYPVPLMTLLLSSFKEVFTKLDLRNACHLVRIREGDEWKMAFNTPIIS